MSINGIHSQSFGKSVATDQHFFAPHSSSKQRELRLECKYLVLVFILPIWEDIAGMKKTPRKEWVSFQTQMKVNEEYRNREFLRLRM